ncbi:MAG: ATP-binding protein [Balneolaceae bacterium]
MSQKNLFYQLFKASTEEELDKVITGHPLFKRNESWKPLGGNENNFGVIENQQSNPIAALIEKITNSIDATLMKRCYEKGIDPRSFDAPQSMNEAKKEFFPRHLDWDLSGARQAQAENIQIIADGPRMNTSLVIYDNGEGQHPEDFENSFLSLLRGNKNDIHFVQGKYNMGGSGAIVFCGKKGYQLIASKRYDGTGSFGFTLIREHPLSKEEQEIKKNTWYEYLVIDGEIPKFEINGIDLGLYNRKFETGTIIKLYSYDLPSGSRSVISRDLNQSINEFLFEPALPVLTVDTKNRYPDDRNLERDLYGLKRRLEKDDNRYIEEHFTEHFRDALFGEANVTCYVFKSRVDGKTVKETKESIQREFFKNNMAVLFSMNGQVHGHYTSEFITRSLKLNLLKSHLLIHVDCTKMNYNFRKEMFMASRDRLKGGEETAALRKFLASKLGSAKSRLTEIEKRRKASLSVDSGDTKQLLKDFTKSLPMNSDLLKLLDQTFKLDRKKATPKNEQKARTKKTHGESKEPFKPERFPSFLKLRAKNDGEKEVAKIPLGGEKNIYFDTDVENHYLHRIDEPGGLKVGLLDYKSNGTDGGDALGKIDKIEDILNVNESSPDEGTIKINFNPTEEAKVGDEIKIRVSLTGAGREFEEIFWVKISDPEQNNQNSPKPKKVDEEELGLPEFNLVYKKEKEGFLTWEKLEDAGIDIGWETVMHPLATGDTLETIYINMDSTVLRDFKSKYRRASQEQLEIADRKYITSVYFHTLFLYTITKNRKYEIIQKDKQGNENQIDIASYLRDLFESYYSEFILNFGGMEELMDSLGE